MADDKNDGNKPPPRGPMPSAPPSQSLWWQKYVYSQPEEPPPVSDQPKGKPLSIDLGSVTDPVGETEAVSLGEFVRRTASNPLPKSEKPFSEREGWLYGGIGGAGFSTVLGVGLVGALYEHQPAGLFVAAIGAGGLIAMAVLLKGHKLTVIHTAIAALISTWVFLGYVLLAGPKPIIIHDVPQSAVSPEKWPPLTQPQISALTSRVRFVPPEDIVVACETINCKDLADGIAEILQNTPGWHVAILHRGGLDISGVTGIRLSPTEPATEALRDAIEATTGLAVALGSETRKDLGTDTRTFLTVGTRPF